MDVLNFINSILWVLGNLTLAYIAIMLVLFVITYFIIFDPRATTGGKLIFQFMLSLLGIILLVFLEVYIDPHSDQMWLTLHEDVDWWRPIVRFLIHAFVAYAITSLAWLLVVRKWAPSRLRKASDIHLVVPRHTDEIPVVKPSDIRPADGPSGDSDTSLN